MCPSRLRRSTQVVTESTAVQRYFLTRRAHDAGSRGVPRWRAGAAPALGVGEVAARSRCGGGRKDPVLLAACLSLAVAI